MNTILLSWDDFISHNYFDNFYGLCANIRSIYGREMPDTEPSLFSFQRFLNLLGLVDTYPIGSTGYVKYSNDLRQLSDQAVIYREVQCNRMLYKGIQLELRKKLYEAYIHYLTTGELLCLD